MLVSHTIPVTVRPIDQITARTTIRLWHELHVERKIAHDFQDICHPIPSPTPDQKLVYLGAIVNFEIKAIVQCTGDASDTICVRRVAHAPHHEVVADCLVRNVANENTMLDSTMKTHQARWFIAYNFYRLRKSPM